MPHIAALCSVVVLSATSCEITVLPLTPFGAEVVLPTNASALPECAAKSLGAALTEHKVVVLRALQLSMDEHVAFARKLGTIDPQMSRPPPYVDAGVHVSDGSAKRKSGSRLRLPGFLTRLRLPGFLARLRKPSQKAITRARVAQIAAGEPLEVFKVVTDPSDVLAFGEGFHTDLTYLRRPPRAAVLLSRLLSPPGTGTTLFLDAFALADTLPADLRARAAGRWAWHTDKAGRNSTHPVVRLVDGRPALWVNRHFTRRLASEEAVAAAASCWSSGPCPGTEPDEESPSDASLLEEVLSHADAAAAGRVAGAPLLRLEWRSVGDLVVWDERAVQHAAVHDYAGHAREMHRVLLASLHGEEAEASPVAEPTREPRACSASEDGPPDAEPSGVASSA